MVHLASLSQESTHYVEHRVHSAHPGPYPERQDVHVTPDAVLRFVGTPCVESFKKGNATWHLRALWCNGLHTGYILTI
jgi:hypothetical protein